jgi:hypothetical protein
MHGRLLPACIAGLLGVDKGLSEQTSWKLSGTADVGSRCADVPLNASMLISSSESSIVDLDRKGSGKSLCSLLKYRKSGSLY